jgi:hypothetical protein
MTKPRPGKAQAPEPVALSPGQAEAVGGGLNPQPLPPRWIRG